MTYEEIEKIQEEFKNYGDKIPLYLVNATSVELLCEIAMQLQKANMRDNLK